MTSLLLAISLIAAQSIDYEMSAAERKQTGIGKLTEKEKAELQNWVDNHYSKRVEPLQQKPAGQGTIQENLKNGRYIRLSDGTLWSIHPQDTPITQSWITPVEILVTQSGDPAYPYKLTNSLTGSSVRAQKATSAT